MEEKLIIAICAWLELRDTKSFIYQNTLKHFGPSSNIKVTNI